MFVISRHRKPEPEPSVHTHYTQKTDFCSKVCLEPTLRFPFKFIAEGGHLGGGVQRRSARQ